MGNEGKGFGGGVATQGQRWVAAEPGSEATRSQSVICPHHRALHECVPLGPPVTSTSDCQSGNGMNSGEGWDLGGG